MARRNSHASTTTDGDTASFVTPLATPSELRDQFPSQLDLEETVERTLRQQDVDTRSERSGTVTPTQIVADATGRPRESSTATGQRIERADERAAVTHGSELEHARHIPGTDPTNAPLVGEPVHADALDEHTRPVTVIPAVEESQSESAPIQQEKNIEGNREGKRYEPSSNGKSGSLKDSTSTSERLDEKDVEVTSGERQELERQISISPGDPTGLTTGVVNGAAAESKSLAVSTHDEDEPEYPGGFKLGIITVGLLLATFVVALDNTIIATAIPNITAVFDSLNDVGWYGSSYLLTTTSLQPTFGKIYTFFNVKYTYLIALLTFEIGSIICATAVNSVMLIVGRAVAGVGAAGLFSGGMTIIGMSVRLEKRAIFIALLSSMFGIASIVGPLLGGVFTDRLSWRWCFWINLPFGGVALATVFIFFKNPKRKAVDIPFKQKLGEMDLLGALFLICGIICLLLALQWGGTQYPWSDSRVWGCLLGFGLIIIVFVGIQIWRGEKGTIPPRIMKQRTVLAGCLFSAFLAMAIYTHIFYLPFYFQSVQGTTAEGSGIRTIPYLVSNTLASIVIGGAITYFGYYNPFLWIGSAIFAVGCGMLYLLKVGDYAGIWIGFQLLAGIGAGACIQIPFISVQVVLSGKDMPTGNALTIFFNTLGGALSVSIAQNIFSNTLLQQLQEKVPQLNPLLIISAGATHVRDVVQSPQLLEPVLEAYDAALTRAFILPIAMACLAFLVSLLFEWKSIKGKNLLGGGAA